MGPVLTQIPINAQDTLDVIRAPMLRPIARQTPIIPGAITTAQPRTITPIRARSGRGGSNIGITVRVRLGYVLLWLIICGSILALNTVAARDNRLSDTQVRELIVQESVNAYLASGRPCACPYNMMRNGQACEGRSAYSRPGGAAPLCYLSDVTAQQVTAWRGRVRY